MGGYPTGPGIWKSPQDLLAGGASRSIRADWLVPLSAQGTPTRDTITKPTAITIFTFCGDIGRQCRSAEPARRRLLDLSSSRDPGRPLQRSAAASGSPLAATSRR